VLLTAAVVLTCSGPEPRAKNLQVDPGRVIASAIQADLYPQIYPPSKEAVWQKCIKLDVAEDCTKGDSGEAEKYQK
jgi:hypothetical protein